MNKPNIYLTPIQAYSLTALLEQKLKINRGFLFRGHHLSLKGIQTKLEHLVESDALPICEKLELLSPKKQKGI